MALKRTLRSLFIVVAALALLLGSSASAQELADRQVLRDGVPDDDITGLDPFLFLGTSGEPMARAIFEGLVRFNFGHVAPDKMEPALAESWEVSEDGRTWTFRLRHGVQFHRGFGEMTAEDVKFSIERHILNDGRHAVDYLNVDSIEVVDPYTVRFNLLDADAFFLYTVGNFHGGYVVSKRAVEELGEDGFRVNPVGTGPFQFSEWISKEKVVLTGFEDYWRGRPILDAIEFIFMHDVNTRTLALQTGEIDITSDGVDDELWVNSMRGQGIIVDLLGFDIPMILHLNLMVEPLNDIRVRQALAHATNREAFVAFHGASISRIQDSPLPPGMFGYTQDGLPQYEYDLERARELLAEAGYPDGFNLGTVLSSVRPLYLDPLQIIQAQWAEIGVAFDIRTAAHNEYQDLIRQDLSPIVGYPGPRPTPDMIFSQYLHSDSIVGKETAVTNFSHYGDVDADGDGEIDSIDALIDEAATANSVERQLELYGQAQIEVMEDLPIIPLRVLAAVQARQPWVDLGHVPYEGSYMNGYTYTELTRILAH